MAKTKSSTVPALLFLLLMAGLDHVVHAQVPASPTLAGTSAHDGEPGAGSGNLTIKKNVRQVVVDVVVTDSHGKAVRGLTQKDFRLTEDGTPQKIVSFEESSLDAPADIPILPHLPVNTFINLPATPERGPLYVLLLDLVNTDTDDQPRARQQLLKFIDDKPDGTRFCVLVLAAGLHLVQGFTDDKKQLYSILDPDNPKNHVPRIFLYGRNYGRGDPLLALTTLADIAEFLSGLPGRKNLIWMAGGFPFVGTVGNEGLTEDIKKVIAGTTQAQIAIYPVALNGLVVDVPKSSAFIGQGQPAESGFGSSLSLEYMQVDALAQSTGGQAAYGRNDLKSALDDIVETSGKYYTLVYSPQNQNYDGTARKIHVELSKHGYYLAYRTYYYAVETAFPMPSVSQNSDSSQPAVVRSVTDSLYANMQHGAPLAHQLVFRAHLQPVGAPTQATAEQMENLADQPAYFRKRQKNKPEKALPTIPLQTYALDFTLIRQKGNASNQAFEIASAAYDAEGHLLNGVVKNGAQEGKADKTDRFYRAQELIDVPLAATSIRIAVRDLSSDRIGAMEIPLPLQPEPTP